MMKQLLTVLAQGLVEKPEGVEVTETIDERGTIILRLHVADGDMGRVIGKQGRIAKAIRTVMRAAAIRNDVRVTVEID